MRRSQVHTVIGAILDERDHQNRKWGGVDSRDQELAGYLLILEEELAEAKHGWMKNLSGRDSVRSELVQIAAVAAAALEEWGLPGDTPEGET